MNELTGSPGNSSNGHTEPISQIGMESANTNMKNARGERLRFGKSLCLIFEEPLPDATDAASQYDTDDRAYRRKRTVRPVSQHAGLTGIRRWNERAKCCHGE
jgi:hypothetical protein